MEVCWDGDVGKGTAGARACVCVRVCAHGCTHVQEVCVAAEGQAGTCRLCRGVPDGMRSLWLVWTTGPPSACWAATWWAAPQEGQEPLPTDPRGAHPPSPSRSQLSPGPP